MKLLTNTEKSAEQRFWLVSVISRVYFFFCYKIVAG